jgi:hypothetical protein
MHIYKELLIRDIRNILYESDEFISSKKLLEKASFVDHKSKSEELIGNAIDSGDINKILQIFSVRKGDLYRYFIPEIGFRSWDDYKDTILRWLDSGDASGSRILAALKKHFPKVANGGPEVM